MQFDTVRGIFGFCKVVATQVILRTGFHVNQQGLKDWNDTIGKQQPQGMPARTGTASWRGTSKVTMCAVEGDVCFSNVASEMWREDPKLGEQMSPVRTNHKEILELDESQWTVQLARTLLPFWEEERQRRESSMREGTRISNSALRWSLDRSQNIDSEPGRDRLEFTNQLAKYSNHFLSRIQQEFKSKRLGTWWLSYACLKLDIVRNFFGVLNYSKDNQHSGSIARFREYGDRRKWRDQHNREAIVGDQEDSEGEEIRWANRAAFKKDYLGNVQGKQSSLYLFANETETSFPEFQAISEAQPLQYTVSENSSPPSGLFCVWKHLPDLSEMIQTAHYDM